MPANASAGAEVYTRMPQSRELSDRVFAAWASWNEARLVFDALNAEVVNRTHGMPVSDGLQAIRNAAETEQKALAEYRDALKKYSDHLRGMERTDFHGG